MIKYTIVYVISKQDSNLIKYSHYFLSNILNFHFYYQHPIVIQTIKKLVFRREMKYIFNSFLLFPKVPKGQIFCYFTSFVGRK